jgi:hypothetical protein
VYSIVKEKDKIKDHVQNAGNTQSTIMSKKQGAAIEEMERSLKLWTEDQHQKNIPVSLSIIQGMAMSLYDDWKKHLGKSAVNAPEFHASKGWFDRFKNRAWLHNIRLTGVSASANKQAALKSVKKFAKIVEEGISCS